MGWWSKHVDLGTDRDFKTYQILDMDGLIRTMTSIVGPLGHWAHMFDPDPNKAFSLGIVKHWTYLNSKHYIYFWICLGGFIDTPLRTCISRQFFTAPGSGLGPRLPKQRRQRQMTSRNRTAPCICCWSYFLVTCSLNLIIWANFDEQRADVFFPKHH